MSPKGLEAIVQSQRKPREVAEQNDDGTLCGTEKKQVWIVKGGNPVAVENAFVSSGDE